MCRAGHRLWGGFHAYRGTTMLTDRFSIETCCQPLSKLVQGTSSQANDWTAANRRKFWLGEFANVVICLTRYDATFVVPQHVALAAVKQASARPAPCTSRSTESNVLSRRKHCRVFLNASFSPATTALHAEVSRTKSAAVDRTADHHRCVDGTVVC